MTMKVLGIDLAGKKENPTGICILDYNIMEFSMYIKMKISMI